MSCILAIYDTETSYANRLTDYIKRKQKRITQVRVFTNPDSLKEHLVHNKIDILLLGEDIPADQIKLENIRNICLLTEGGRIKEEGGYPVIYKFQSADLVVREIFSYFPTETNEGNRKETGNNLRIITVFSTAKNDERTMLSLSLAGKYASGKKVLYVNLDTIHPFSEYQDTGKSLSEFIYYLKQNTPNLITKLNEIISRRNQLDFIGGVSFGPDLFDLAPDDIALWIKELKKYSEYEVIIFDVGSFFLAALELFRESNRILYLLGGNDLEQTRFRILKDQLCWAGFEDITQKLTAIVLNGAGEKQYQEFAENGWYCEEYAESAAACLAE